MPQDIRISPDGKTFYVADMMAGGVFTDRRRGLHGNGLHQDRRRDARPLPEPRRHEALRRQPRARPASRGRPTRAGQRVGPRFRRAHDRGHLADSRRRQPRHGERERGRQDSVALGSLRRRGLRHRHRDGARSSASPSGRSPTASPSGRSQAATRSATLATCAEPSFCQARHGPCHSAPAGPRPSSLSRGSSRSSATGGVRCPRTDPRTPVRVLSANARRLGPTRTEWVLLNSASHQSVVGGVGDHRARHCPPNPKSLVQIQPARDMTSDAVVRIAYEASRPIGKLERVLGPSLHGASPGR